MKRIIFGSTVLLLSGCMMIAGSMKHFSETGLDRAAFDFGCGKEKLNVVKVGDISYGVTGCDKKAVYVYNGVEYIRNSQVGSSDK